MERMISGQLFVRVIAARGRDLHGDLIASVKVGSQKLKTKTTSTPSLQTDDLLGVTSAPFLRDESTIEYRWNDDMLFWIDDLNGTTLDITVSSAGLVKKKSIFSVDVPLSDLGINPDVIGERDSVDVQLLDQKKGSERPKHGNARIFKSWLRDKSGLYLIFVIMQFTPLPQYDGASSKKKIPYHFHEKITASKCLLFMPRNSFVSGEVIRGTIVYNKSTPRDVAEDRPPLLILHGSQTEFDNEGSIAHVAPMIRVAIPLWRSIQKPRDISQEVSAAAPTPPPTPDSASAHKVVIKKAKRATTTGASLFRYDTGSYIWDFEIYLPPSMFPSFVTDPAQGTSSELSYYLTLHGPTTGVLGPVIANIPIHILPRVPYAAIHSPSRLIGTVTFKVDENGESKQPGSKANILQSLKGSKYKPLPNSNPSSPDDTPGEAEEKEAKEPGNLKVSVVVHKGYININDPEDIDVVALIENNCEEKFVRQLVLTIGFVITRPLEAYRSRQRWLPILTMKATEESSPKSLPVEPRTTREVMFTIKRSAFLSGASPAYDSAQHFVMPICTTGPAPLRAVSCEIQLEVITDTRKKSSNEQMLTVVPITFIPQYVPNAISHTVDQSKLPNTTPKTAGRAAPRPDLALSVAPSQNSGRINQHFLFNHLTALPIPANSSPQPDSLANKRFALLPLPVEETLTPLPGMRPSNSSTSLSSESTETQRSAGADSVQTPERPSTPSSPSSPPVYSPSSSSSPDRPRRDELEPGAPIVPPEAAQDASTSSPSASASASSPAVDLLFSSPVLKPTTTKKKKKKEEQADSASKPAASEVVWNPFAVAPLIDLSDEPPPAQPKYKHKNPLANSNSEGESGGSSSTDAESADSSTAQPEEEEETSDTSPKKQWFE